jgi:hypothetical protein
MQLYKTLATLANGYFAAEQGRRKHFTAPPVWTGHG